MGTGLSALRHLADCPYTLAKALYWGTSEWTAREIEEAHRKANISHHRSEGSDIHVDVATRLNLISPIAEQCRHK